MVGAPPHGETPAMDASTSGKAPMVDVSPFLYKKIIFFLKPKSEFFFLKNLFCTCGGRVVMVGKCCIVMGLFLFLGFVVA